MTKKEKEMEEKKYIIYDQLKLWAILFVVIGHCLNMYGDDGAVAVASESWLFGALATIVYRFHIPMLFAVSGALFALGAGKGKYGEFRPYIRNKGRRLLVPYLVFAFFAVFPTILICGLLPVKEFYKIFWYVLSGFQVRHLWYLYCLFLVFVLIRPFKRYIVRKTILIALLISLVLSIGVRGTGWTFLQYFQIGNTFYFQFFFLCGAAMELYFAEICDFLLRRLYFIPVCLALLIVSVFVDVYVFTGYIYAFAGMVLLLYLAMLVVRSERFIEFPLVDKMTKDSYGIYLFHAMLVYLIFFCFSKIAVPPLLLIVIAFSVSLTLAFLFTEICRRFGLEWIIGEGGGKKIGNRQRMLRKRKGEI